MLLRDGERMVNSQMAKLDLLTACTKRLVCRAVDLLCPPTCSVCQNPATSGSELCDNCTKKFIAERGAKCPNCNNPASSCECGCDFSRITRTVIGKKTHLSLSFYEGSQNAYNDGRITERMILRLKTHGNFARFFSDMLCAEIEMFFRVHSISIEDWILTYPPRSVQNFKKYGFDQSEEVTRHMARRLGISRAAVFEKRDGDEQKSLGSRERADNAESTIAPIKNAVKQGGKYLLFDDIITSGATITTAARHLYFCGASEVFPISIAKTICR